MQKLFLVSSLLLVSLGATHADQFAEFRQQYETLATLAGNGKRDEGNDWRPGDEGKLATQVDLSRPHMCMADAEGNYYIADKEANAIRKVLPDGTIHTVAGTGQPGYSGDGKGTECQLFYPNGLYVQPDGTLYILDLNNHRIRRLDREGNLTTVIHDKEGILIGRGLWVRPDAKLIYYSSHSRIRKWTPEEGIITLADGFASLGNIAVDSKGVIYATDRVGGRVYQVTERGGKTHLAGNGRTRGGGHGKPAVETAMLGARGIALLDDGAFLVATHKGGDVWYVDSGGLAHLFIEGEGNGKVHRGDGQPLERPGPKISEPRAIVHAPSGDLILTTNDEGYVRLVKRKKPSKE